MVEATIQSVVPERTFGDLLNTLETINSSFDPRFTKLSPEQRKAKNAVGLKRKGFVETAHLVAKKNPDFVPNFFDIDEFDRNMADVREVAHIHNMLTKIFEYVRNAEVILGNEAYRSALSIHRYLREASRSGMSGAKPLYQKLKKQFPNGSKKAETAGEAANGTEGSGKNAL
jgi:hypothetical protein